MDLSSASSRFFKPQETKSSGTYTNLGVDFGFLSLAAAIIDLYLNKTPLSERSTHKIIHYLQKYLPDLGEKLESTTNTQLEALISKEGVSVMVHNLAFVLRQIAIDTITKNPSKYWQVCNKLKPEEKILRDPDQYIHPVALAAVSDSLELPMIIATNDLHHNMPSRKLYNLTQKNPLIYLEQNGDIFRPKLEQSEKFARVKEITRNYVEALNKQPVDPNLEKTISDKLKADKQEIALYYEKTVKRLETMLDANELDDDALIKMYTESVISNPTNNNCNYGGLRDGTDKFFQEVLAPNAHSANPNSTSLSQKLISAISQAVCLGVTSLDVLFDDSLSPRR